MVKRIGVLAFVERRLGAEKFRQWGAKRENFDIISPGNWVMRMMHQGSGICVRASVHL